MTLRLDLLRHGETLAAALPNGGGLRGSLDDALSPLGWQQMQASVASLSERRVWDRIISSPLQRCAQFAQSLSEQLSVPMQLDADFKELHFGEWEGVSPAQLMETDPEGLGRFWENPYRFTPPAGEPVADFATRVLGGVQRVQQAYDGERVLLICHGGVMRLLLAQARGLPREQLLQVTVGHGALIELNVATHGELKEV